MFRTDFKGVFLVDYGCSLMVTKWRAMKVAVKVQRKSKLITPKLTVDECDAVQTIIEAALSGGLDGDRANAAGAALDKLKVARADARGV